MTPVPILSNPYFPNDMRKALLLGLAALALPAAVSAQVLFQENFAYPAGTPIGGTGASPTLPNATTGWATHSGTSGQLLVNGTGLTFASIPTYPSQTGGSLNLLSTQGEDISHQFTPQVPSLTTTSVYVSALVRPDATPNGTNGSYFLHVAQSSVAGTTFRGRVFMGASPNPGNVRFGITVAGNTPVMGTTDVPIGTTVLLVMRYDIVPGTTNDGARLYLLPAGSNIATEPVVPEALAVDLPASDPTDIGAVAIREGTTGTPAQNSGSQTIDGVRVGLSWNDAPLPVELNAFTATVSGTSARLAWTTASETNNAGFTVEQQTGDAWNERGFVAGRGTTTERNDYTFSVTGLTAGTHAFRLRQTDTDGTVHYSAVATVEVSIDGSEGRVTLLGQRAVRVETNEAQAVSVRVFDVLGRVVSQQRSDVSGTGVFELPSMAAGAYVVRVEGERFAQTRTLVVR